MALILSGLLISLLHQGALSTTFTFQNNCLYTLWPATLSGTAQLPLTGFELAAGASQAVNAPDGIWSGRIWTRTQCSTDGSGKFSCLTGDCATGQVACNGAGGAAATLAEFTLRGGADSVTDFYDTSNVDGFNVPLSITPQGGGNCTTTSCAANINSQCPNELQTKSPDGDVVGCKSACTVFGSGEYCCKGNFEGPELCKPTYYSVIFKTACPTTYSYPYDDQTSTFTCSGANYLITFCPGEERASPDGMQPTTPDRSGIVNQPTTPDIFGIGEAIFSFNEASSWKQRIPSVFCHMFLLIVFTILLQ